MEINNISHSSAYAPTPGTPHDGSLSCAAQTRTCAAPAGVFMGTMTGAVTGDAVGPVAGIATGVDTSVAAAVRLDDVRVQDLFPGSHAWSPPIS